MEALAKEGRDAFKLAETKRRAEREIAPLMQEVESALRERETGDIIIDRNRADLFSGGKYNAPNFDGNDNDQMMSALIQDSDELLLESQALCAQSEQIGSGTLNTMGMQRDQLHSAGEHLRGARSTLEQAKHLLQDLNNKALRNKRFLYCIITVLITANILVIVAIIKKIDSSESNRIWAWVWEIGTTRRIHPDIRRTTLPILCQREMFLITHTLALRQHSLCTISQ